MWICTVFDAKDHILQCANHQDVVKKPVVEQKLTDFAAVTSNDYQLYTDSGILTNHLSVYLQ